MRYAVASFFTLLVVGAASAVPDDEATIAGRLPTAPHPTRCEVIAEPVIVSPAAWEEFRPAPHPGAAPRAESVAGVETALHEFVACLNDRPSPASLPGIGSGRMALVWVGEPWLLPNARVAASIIARGEAGAEAWSLVVMTSHGDRYVIDAVLAFDARNQSSPFTHRNPLTSSDLPG